MRFIYNSIVSSYLFKKFYKYDVKSIYHNLLSTQYISLNEIEFMQEELLNNLIKYAIDNCDYYSKLIPAYPITLGELRNIKPVMKKEIVDYYNDIYNSGSAKEFVHLTSGSSGQPLKIVTSNASEAHRMAHRLRFYQWWGLRPSDANVLLWGRMNTENSQNRNNIRAKFKRYIKGKTLNINVFDLNSKTIKEYYDQMVRIRPKYIRGYRSGLYQLAHLLEKYGLDGSKIGLNVAIVTSEIIYDEHREYIERILNVKVADEYGAAEIGMISHECPSGSKHICEELVYVYTNEENEVIVTDLHNYSMPLINYKLGDKIHIGGRTCECGRTSRIVEKIEGRSHDYIITESGDYMTQAFFYYIINELATVGFANSVVHYRIIQNRLHFDFIIVKGNNFQDGVENYLRKRMEDTIGKSLTVKFQYVDEIPREKSGKLRFFERVQ
jgi:phenylacetate-CoA ligase